jgi:hypothetical protein
MSLTVLSRSRAFRAMSLFMAATLTYSASATGFHALRGRKYTGHALDRMQGRGIPPSKVEDVIKRGKRSPGKDPGTTKIERDGFTVIVNKKGDVVSVW